jgi:programmed cell death 6-interacting protein
MMLQVDFKKTDAVSLVVAFRHYIATYYQLNPEEFNDDCFQLEQLRESIRTIDQAGDRARQLLWTYYQQLCRCCVRFNLEGTSLSLEFTWKQVFGKGQSTSSSLNYERLCVLFNLAALYSQLGVKQPKVDGEHLKLAYNYFQWSAGLWHHLRDEVEHYFGSAVPSLDLYSSTLLSLEYVMLAQAQECFMQKAIADQMKDITIAKLATHLAYLYNASISATQDLSIKGLFEGSWLHHLNAKSFYSSALAYYYRGRDAETQQEQGVCVACMRAGEEILKKSLDHGKNLDSKFLNELKNFQTTLSQSKNQAERHNDLVYHAEVPDPLSLPELVRADMVKSIEPKELVDGCQISPALFVRLIPPTIYIKAAEYRKQQEQLVQDTFRQLDEATLAFSR